MDIQQIKNFVILGETLNFRKAAEQINIVQPALSRQIQLLENEMLLTRKTDIGVAPNIVLPPDVSSKILYRENFVLILPASHPLSKKKLNDLSVLKNETFILPQLSTGVGYVEAILQICHSFN